MIELVSFVTKNKEGKMKLTAFTTDALRIANAALDFYEDNTPIGIFVKEDDFKRLQNKDKIKAISSLTRQWTIEELKQKKVLFISYHRKIDVLPIEANWELFFGNKNLIYLKVKDEKVAI